MKKLDKILEALIFVFAIGGTFAVTFNEEFYQILGFVSWIIANFIAIYLMSKKKMWFLVAQYVVFQVLNIMGIMNRL